MATMFTVGEAAPLVGCLPKTLTDWLYLGTLDRRRCPIIGGRRMIPASYLDTIRRELRLRGIRRATANDREIETRSATNEF